jgi:hypothetical protein
MKASDSARMEWWYVVEVSDAAWLTGSGRSHWAWLAVVVARRCAAYL